MRRFLPKFLIPIVAFLTLFFYWDLYLAPNQTDDLGALGQIPFGRAYGGLGNIPNYERPVMPGAEVVQVDKADSLSLYSIITLGDSFSQCGVYGYQYYLSFLCGTPVANFKRANSDMAPQAFINLLNSGKLKTGQTVIIETVDRNTPLHFKSLDFFKLYADEELENSSRSSSTKSPLPRFLSWIRYKLSPGRNPVKCFQLTREVFTPPASRFASTLYVYEDDLFKVEREDTLGINAKVQRLTEMADSSGIRLFFLVAADKYDCYYPWVKNPKIVPQYCGILPRDNVLLTLDALQNTAKLGVKDIYKISDSHWSSLGADIVAETLYRQYFSDKSPL